MGMPALLDELHALRCQFDSMQPAGSSEDLFAGRRSSKTRIVHAPIAWTERVFPLTPSGRSRKMPRCAPDSGGSS